MHLKKYIVALLMISAFGCTMGKNPSWVANGIHPGYAPDQFLIGIGLSSRSRDAQADVQKADTNARLEVAKQLKVRIQSNLTSRKEQKTSLLLPQTYSSRTSMDVKEDVELLLGGITIVDRYFSKKDNLHYSVAALNKRETAKRLASEIARHSNNVSVFSRQSDLLLKNGDVTGALQRQIKALDQYRQYTSKKQMVVILDPDASGSTEAPPVDPYDGLVELKNSIALIALDGNMQAGRIGRALDSPLRVKALYNQKTPINNLPVTAQFAGHAGRAERNRVTDNGGKADIKVLEIHKTRTHVNLITVSVDWNRIIHEALEHTPDTSWDGFLSGPSVNFKYKLRVPNVTHVLITVCNQSGYSNVNATSIVHPMSVDLLKDKGFLIKKSGRTVCSGSLSTESIVRTYKRLADIVIVEKVDVDYSSRRGRGYVFRARMSVTAYDMAYGEIIASVEGEALGGANSRKSAAERAIKEVADELIPQVASRIAEGL